MYSPKSTSSHASPKHSTPRPHQATPHQTKQAKSRKSLKYKTSWDPESEEKRGYALHVCLEEPWQEVVELALCRDPPAARADRNFFNDEASGSNAELVEIRDIFDVVRRSMDDRLQVLEANQTFKTATELEHHVTKLTGHMHGLATDRAVCQAAEVRLWSWLDSAWRSRVNHLNLYADVIGDLQRQFRAKIAALKSHLRHWQVFNEGIVELRINLSTLKARVNLFNTWASEREGSGCGSPSCLAASKTRYPDMTAEDEAQVKEDLVISKTSFSRLCFSFNNIRSLIEPLKRRQIGNSLDKFENRIEKTSLHLMRKEPRERQTDHAETRHRSEAELADQCRCEKGNEIVSKDGETNSNQQNSSKVFTLFDVLRKHLCDNVESVFTSLGSFNNLKIFEDIWIFTVTVVMFMLAAIVCGHLKISQRISLSFMPQLRHVDGPPPH